MTGSSPCQTPLVRTVGVDAMLVSFGDALSEPANRAALAFRASVDDAQIPGVVESSTSLVSTLVRIDLTQTTHGAVQSRLDALLASKDWHKAPLPASRKSWVVPAVFGGDFGPQLDHVAQLAGVSAVRAIQEITARPVRVQTIGFAPGMPYLGELPSRWDIARSTKLTPRVPAGGICLAIRQLVLFPVDTQTGWHHIGQSALRVFQPETTPPFVLAPGDEVQLQPVSADEFAMLSARDDGGVTLGALA